MTAIPGRLALFAGILFLAFTHLLALINETTKPNADALEFVLSRSSWGTLLGLAFLALCARVAAPSSGIEDKRSKGSKRRKAALRTGAILLTVILTRLACSENSGGSCDGGVCLFADILTVLAAAYFFIVSWIFVAAAVWGRALIRGLPRPAVLTSMLIAVAIASTLFWPNSREDHLAASRERYESFLKRQEEAAREAKAHREREAEQAREVLEQKLQQSLPR